MLTIARKSRRSRVRPVRKTSRSLVESLESRVLLDGLPNLPITPPLLHYVGGTINYNYNAMLGYGILHLSSFPVDYFPDGTDPEVDDPFFATAPRSVILDIAVTATGQLYVGGGDHSGQVPAGADYELTLISGLVDDPFFPTVILPSTTLITGEVQTFEYQSSGSGNQVLQLRFSPTVGASPMDGILNSQFSGLIGMTVLFSSNTFDGSFNHNFSGSFVEGLIGAIPDGGGGSPASLSGMKFNDVNGDGVQDPAEPGLAGWTINLSDSNGTLIASTVTGAGGTYSFSGLEPGTYTVQEALQGGWTQTFGVTGHTVTLLSGDVSTGNNFGNFHNINISGNKSNDLTGNSFSGDDTPLGGVTINLHVGNSTAGPIIASTVTAPDGTFSFGNVGPGTFFVQEVVPAGSQQTGGSAGYVITTTSGSNSTGNNFANFKKIIISGNKVNDITGNSFSGDDTPLGGVTINLHVGNSTAGPIIASTVTAADGTFSFGDVGPGTYFVQEVLPAGSIQTGGSAGYVITTTSGVDSTGNNFANFKKIIISGNKVNDLTGNSFSGDDTPLAGVTINLHVGTSTAGPIIATTITGADGSFSFGDVGPGTYFVQEVVPAGSLQTGGSAGYVITTTSGTNSTGNNFANFKKITISGTKTNDLTGNSFSGDDTPLGGVTINLHVGNSTAGPIIATTVTAPNGTFSFSDVGPGTYFVQEVLPAGSIQTGGSAGYVITTASGNNSTGNNFANFKKITVSGTKYNDITGNNVSGDDTPQGGVTINLYQGTSTAGALLATTVSAANGTFSFGPLGPGTYFVQEVVPAGSIQTGGTAGYVINATSGQNSTGNNFANFKKITVSGTKFNDLTGNSFSADDTPLSGTTIRLYQGNSSTGTLLGSTVTAANGAFSFGPLGPGTYYVQEVVPAGYSQTGGNAGYVINATSGINSAGNDFANFKTISISGKKYNDICGNDGTAGIGSDDIVLGGVTINLYKNGGTSPVATTVTGTDGSYSFTNLAPGTYTVKESVPAGWTQTYGNAGYTINATSGNNYTNKNFADFKNICISGEKYNDLNGNGCQDAGEPGLPNWTIKLYNSAGAVIATTTTDANGDYSFCDLGPGCYTVKEVQQTGWIRTSLPPSYTVTPTSGTNITGLTFGNFQVRDCFCNISCIKYVINGCTTVTDLTGNVKQGDTVKVIFTIAATDTLSLVSYTAPDSYFVAENAYQQKIFDVATATFGPGTHSLTVVVPDCNFQIDFICGTPICTFGPAGSNIFYTPQGRLIDADNGGTCDPGTFVSNTGGTGSVSGNIFSDTNNNGVKNTGEVGIPNVKVTLTGTTSGGVKVMMTTLTDSAGNYKFVNLKSGNYKVSEGSFDDFYDGKDTVGSTGGTAYNDVISGITLASGENATGYNFADLNDCSISGRVYRDYDKDGVVDTGDYGLSNVKITLTGTDDLGQSVYLITYTDANGFYTFQDLRAGTYKLTETTPTGYVTTKNVVGTAGGSVSGDSVSNIVLTWGKDATGYNFGEYK